MLSKHTVNTTLSSKILDQIVGETKKEYKDKQSAPLIIKEKGSSSEDAKQDNDEKMKILRGTKTPEIANCHDYSNNTQGKSCTKILSDAIPSLVSHDKKLIVEVIDGTNITKGTKIEINTKGMVNSKRNAKDGYIYFGSEAPKVSNIIIRRNINLMILSLRTKKML